MMNYHEAMKEANRVYWRAALTEAGSVRKAAQMAGVNRTYLHKLLTKLGGVTSPRPVHRGQWNGLTD
jgi:DNA-binding NtrC family response regulator